MATNVFFNAAVKSEQDMYEDLIIESISMYGQDVIYIPREEISRDDILNESYSKFDDGYTVEMYIENVDSFEGEGDLLSKFGLEIRDQATFIVAKRRWERQVGEYELSVRPMEGDLIYLTMSKSLFEIKFVEHEQPFYQLQNLPVYKLQAELFEYTDERIDTGIDQIDQIERLNATQYAYSLLYTGTGDYTIGEKVIQWTGSNDSEGDPINIEGEVAAWEINVSDQTKTLTVVSHVTTDGKFQEFYVSSESTKQVVGTESTTSYEVITADISDNFLTDQLAANERFEYEADQIIDFTEGNPFGMP